MTFWEKLCLWVEGDQDERQLWFSDSPTPSEAPKQEAPAPMTKAEKDRIFLRLYHFAGIVMLVVLLVSLLLIMFNLPTYGNPENPTNNELSSYYIEHGLEDAGATNLVANMILSYRVFDTFGESSVLFLAAASVIMLLSRDSKNTNEQLLQKYRWEDSAEYEAKDRLLRSCTRILLPAIATFGIYVIFNGHLSPGGGFAGGSILGGGLILYAQEFSNRGVKEFFTEHLYHIIKVTALAVYGLLLLYYAFTGANGLDSHIWLGIPGTILSSGIIMPINFMVGFEVACTIYAFYALFHKGEL